MWYTTHTDDDYYICKQTSFFVYKSGESERRTGRTQKRAHVFVGVRKKRTRTVSYNLKHQKGVLSRLIL